MEKWRLYMEKFILYFFSLLFAYLIAYGLWHVLKLFLGNQIVCGGI